MPARFCADWRFSSPIWFALRFKLPETIEWLGAETSLTAPSLPGEALLEAACRGRGWLLSGGRFDLERGAALVLDEFRAGKVGKISLELPEV